jgi:hypothetical protein
MLRAILALGIGIGFLGGAGTPAFAGPPNLGPDWVLKDTKKVREWSASPAKAGRGKWKLKSVGDRKYFMPDNMIDTSEEKTLDSSSLDSQSTEKVPLSREVKNDEKGVSFKTRSYEVKGAKRKQRALEGRSFNTYDTWAVTTKKDTIRVTPQFEEIKHKERIKKLLRNTYRVKTTRTFQDPKTKGKMSFAQTRIEPPVVETDYGPYKEVTTINKLGNVESLDKTEDVGLRQDKEKVGSSAAANIDASGAAGMAGAGTAFASGPNRGSSGANFNNMAVTEKLTKAEKTKASGAKKVAKTNLDALYQAAIMGATLYDDDGFPWKLDFDDGSVVFTTGGAQFRLAQGMTETVQPGGKIVRIDSVNVNPGSISLSGQFKGARGKPSATLKTK